MIMQIKENTQLKNDIEYYETFYDLLRTPDFNDSSRLLKPVHGMQIIGNSRKKICRFCGKDESTVSFSKCAHVFPEAIGNHVLASNYECDECNEFFGDTIENEYANFFSLHHSIMQIPGKNGVPKCKYKVSCDKRTDQCREYCVEINFKDEMPIINPCKEVGKEYIDISNNAITISKPVGKCCPIAVFKSIVKMAISVMPVEELSLFSHVISWLRNPQHSNFYQNKKLLIRYKMIPGFNVTKFPCYALYRRKKDNLMGMPYMLFNLTYACCSLFVEIPRDTDKSSNKPFENMVFPPIPFITSSEGMWDMSQKELPKGFKHSITLNFDGKSEVSDEIEISK